MAELLPFCWGCSGCSGENRKSFRALRSGGGTEAERRRSGGGAEAERGRSDGAATAQALATPPSNRFSHSTLRFALVHASCEIKRAFARTPRDREARRRRLLLCCLRLFERTDGGMDGGHGGRPRAGLAACTRRSRSGRNPRACVVLLCGCLVPGFLEIKEPPCGVPDLRLIAP